MECIFTPTAPGAAGRTERLQGRHQDMGFAQAAVHG
jgi:hypothetical protein